MLARPDARLTSSTDPTLRARSALDELADAALKAGAIAMRDFRPGEKTSSSVSFKRGGSPVTAADLAVDAYLKTRLRAAFPQAGWLSEETADDPARLERVELIVVDPIDGTRAFLTGDPRWAVAIALVSDGRPIAGVVHAPALGETYAAADGCGATHNGAPIDAGARPQRTPPLIGGPRTMVEAIARKLGVELEAAPRIPSLALRLARVANGALDFALASADAHDWDVAAADAILRESGAPLIDAGGEPLRYNRPETRRGALVAAGRGLPPAYLEAALAVLGRGAA
jgi:myo-inositol-1(or 4)-monophosphatase